MKEPGEDRAARLTDALAAAGVEGAEVAVVLGSGLGAFAERLADARAFAFEALDGMPRSTVPGHTGRFVLGKLGRSHVLVQEGRLHLYEGRTPEEVTRAARAFARLGVRALLLTNAAGGTRAEWAPGTLMRIEDHLNLTGRVAPFSGPARAGSPYDPELGARLDAAAGAAGLALARGVYAGFLGPSYETPAEIRLARWAGADAVGMSTVLEALAAASQGVRVAALSLITNHAAGIAREPLSHADVLAVGRAAAGEMERLLARAVTALV